MSIKELFYDTYKPWLSVRLTDMQVDGALTITNPQSNPGNNDYITKAYADSHYSGGGGGSSIWGQITGTLSNQTDLQNALNLKANITYVDNNDAITLLDANTYTDTKTAQTLTTANNYTDSQLVNYGTLTYINTQDSNTLSNAEAYTDIKAAQTLSSAQTYTNNQLLNYGTLTYINNQDNLKLDLTGGTLTGNLDMGTNKITSTYTPINPEDLTNKAYVDQQVSSGNSNSFTLNSNTAGNANNFKIFNLANGTNPNDAINLQQLNNAISGISGFPISTNVDVNSGTNTFELNKLYTSTIPSNNTSVVNKLYSDTQDSSTLNNANNYTDSQINTVNTTLSNKADISYVNTQDTATLTSANNYTDIQINTVNTALANKVNKSGDTMTGNLNMGTNKITINYTPTIGTDAVNKTYADSLVSSSAQNINNTQAQCNISSINQINMANTNGPINIIANGDLNLQSSTGNINTSTTDLILKTETWPLPSTDLAATVQYVNDAIAGSTGMDPLPLNNIYVGDGANEPQPRPVSGDVTLSTLGVITINNEAVTSSKIANQAVDSTKIANNTITNTQLATNTIQTSVINNFVAPINALTPQLITNTDNVLQSFQKIESAPKIWSTDNETTMITLSNARVGDIAVLTLYVPAKEYRLESYPSSSLVNWKAINYINTQTISAKVSRSVVGTTVSGTTTILQVNTVDYSQGSITTAINNNFPITITTSGIYHVTACINYTNGNNDTQPTLNLLLNGNVVQTGSQRTQGGNLVICNLSQSFNLSIGNTIGVSVLYTGGTGTWSNLFICVDQVNATNNALQPASSTTDGYLKASDFALFLANSGGNSLPVYCVNSGDVDSNGTPTLISKANDSTVNLGSYICTYPNGANESNNPTSITGILDGSYIVIKEQSLNPILIPATTNIFEQANVPSTSNDGDYWLYIATKPYMSFKKILGVWQPVQFIKLGEVFKTGGLLTTHLTYTYNGKYISIRPTVANMANNVSYSISHNIGTTLLKTQLYFKDAANKPWAELSFFTSSDAGIIRGVACSYGTLTPSNTTLTIKTGTSAITPAFSTNSYTGANTSGFYYVVVERTF